MTSIGGMILTGGTSRRMGVDKASLMIEGRSCAQRVSAALTEVASPVVEVGPARTGLESVYEAEAGSGPLVALVAGWRYLVSIGWDGPVLVLACDLPLVNPELLRALADWPGADSAVPVLCGRRQPLLARWSPRALATAATAASAGQRSLRGHPEGAVHLDESAWGTVASWRALADVDTPGDLVRLGLSARPVPPVLLPTSSQQGEGEADLEAVSVWSGRP